MPARLIRFMLVTAAVHWLTRLLTAVAAKGTAEARLKLRLRLAVGGWIIFYAAYFSLMPN